MSNTLSNHHEVACCRICGSNADFIGCKKGEFIKRTYHLHHCQTCDFYFISDPSTEYNRIYGPEYYHGKGADKLIDYVFEVENPNKTTRIYEYRGILKIIQSLAPMDEGVRGIDYGCGTGGLVKYISSETKYDVCGYDTGYGIEIARQQGVRVLTDQELKSAENGFDAVTSIETIEHVEDPRGYVKNIHSLLKKGGVFLLTTGNAKPFARNLLAWKYVIPEMHINFFTPTSLKKLFESEGLVLGEIQKRRIVDIYKYKILKNLRLKERSLLLEVLPWKTTTHLVDRHYHLSDTIVVGTKP